MISIREEIAIAMPPDLLWPILSDPAMVASCIPGAVLTKSDEGGIYQGTMRVKFGPTVALFRGEAKLAYDHYFVARRNSLMTILADAARSRGAGSTGGVPRGQMPPGQSRRPAATRPC
jgi:carbon monoxide dehydrogenase subunit G